MQANKLQRCMVLIRCIESRFKVLVSRKQNRLVSNITTKTIELYGYQATA